MSTTPDTRQLPDHVLQAAIDGALRASSIARISTFDASLHWSGQAPARLALARALLARLPEPTPPSAESALAQAGVFKGADGLRQLAECDSFWEKQPYGTRFYFDDSAAYLHRGVLRSCIQILDGKQPTPPTAGVKTPGQVNHDAVVNGDYDNYKKWSELSERGKRDVERGASAVLAAFGGQASLEAGIKRMYAVTNEEMWRLYHSKGCALEPVRTRLIAAAREGQPAVEAEPVCVCQEPEAKGITHRQDGPCHVAEPPEEYRIKPETTFEAHGQTWTKHDGGPMPCKERDLIYPLFKDGTMEDSPHEAGTYNWGKFYREGLSIVGWRYADKPKAEPVIVPPPQPWQPAVGDVVMLRSGGPAMTVHRLGDVVTCYFFTNGYDYGQIDISAACLMPAEEAQP